MKVEIYAECHEDDTAENESPRDSGVAFVGRGKSRKQGMMGGVNDAYSFPILVLPAGANQGYAEARAICCLQEKRAVLFTGAQCLPIADGDFFLLPLWWVCMSFLCQ